MTIQRGIIGFPVAHFNSDLSLNLSSLESAVEALAGVLGGDAIRPLLAESHVFALGAIVDSKGASDILPTVINLRIQKV